jgi:O-antigen/teichoic acid export membrane protein
LIRKKTYLGSGLFILGGALAIACNLLLIPRYGIMGAAYANVVACGTLAAVYVFVSQRIYRLVLDYRRLARICLVGLACAVALLVVSQLGLPVAARLAMKVVVLMAFFPLVVLFGGFDAIEMRAIFAYLRSILGSLAR